MKIKQLLKTIAKAFMTVFVAQEAMAYDETLHHRMAYDIDCPSRTLEEMGAKGYPMTSDWLNVYGLQHSYNASIIGNSEWTLIPYSYSSPEHRNIIRDGAYSSKYADGQACLFFEKNIPYPTSMECYYHFYEDPSYVARDGIDKFALSTRLKAPSFSNVDRTSGRYNGNCHYERIDGLSVYDPDRNLDVYKCGYMRTLKYQETALKCKSQDFNGCNLISFAPSIPDEKLNITQIEDKQKEVTPPISRFFNETKPCVCNCNCNCNITVNAISKHEDYIQDENETVVERGRNDCKCKNDKAATSGASKTLSYCLML